MLKGAQRIKERKTELPAGKSRWRRILPFLVMAVAVAICMIPNCFSGIPRASDEPFHLARIYSLADALRAGIFPVKIHSKLCYGMGYGVGIFYDNALLYIPAILILLGFSLEAAYKIFIAVIFFLAAVSMYESCRLMAENRQQALACAVLYLFSNRMVGQLYLDFTIGNLCGAVFMPIAVVGFYLWLRDRKHLWMFVLGFIGLLYSHAISTLLAFTMCILILIFRFRWLLKKRIFFSLVAASVFILGVTCAYWLPMLEQFHIQIYKSQAPWTTEEQNVLSLSGLVTNTRGIGLTMVVVLCLTAVLLILMWKQRRSQTVRDAWMFWMIGVIFTLLPCCYLFWHLLNRHFTLIQFPARLFLPATVLILFAFHLAGTQMAAGKSAEKFRKRELTLNGILVFFGIVVACYTYFPSAIRNVDREVLEEVENYEIAGAGAGQEWLPNEVNVDTLREQGSDAIADDGTVAEGEKSDYNSIYTFEADPSKEYYDVPYIYYRGYVAVDTEGNTYELDKNPETGQVRVFMPEEAGDKVTIQVTYKSTHYQRLSYLASIAMLLIGAVWLLIRRRRSVSKQ